LLKTNRDSLLELAAVGEITPTVVDPTYMTTWNGEPIVGMGRGGIVYNVKVVDSCFKWA
jgi:hypothetical protein